MLLARASARRREISVRLAVGASRSRLIQQLLAEGMVLGTLGSVVAAGFAWALIRALASVPLPLPVHLRLDVQLDARVLAFSVLVAVSTGLLAGLLPALKSSSPTLVADLRGEAPVARVAGRRWALRDALVAGQVALTVVLLVVAGLLLRSLSASERADVGFRPSGLAVVSFDTDMVRYPREKGVLFWAEALARVRALPGVTAAATASPSIPFELNYSQADVRIDNRTYAEGRPGEVIENREVTPGYLDMMGIRLVEGRDFSGADRPGTPLVAMVSQTMARTYWPGESALGHTFRSAATRDEFQIVGVFSDHRLHSVLERPAPLVHFAALQRPARYNQLLVRAAGAPGPVLESMRRELLSMEPNLVFLNNSTMDDVLALSLMPARAGAVLAAGFGALGLLLAAIGLYGVIAFSVARRTREIGLRIALGAHPRDVVTMVMRQGLGLALIGLVVGGAIAAAAAQVLSGLLFGVTPLDPVAWGAACTALIAAAAAANLVPARRAMRVEPLSALRTE